MTRESSWRIGEMLASDFDLLPEVECCLMPNKPLLDEPYLMFDCCIGLAFMSMFECCMKEAVGGESYLSLCASSIKSVERPMAPTASVCITLNSEDMKSRDLISCPLGF